MTPDVDRPQGRYRVRARAMAAFAVAIASFVAFVVANEVVGLPKPWLLLGPAFIAGIYLSTLRCPEYRRHIFLKTVQVGDSELTYWGGWIPRECSRCGKDLG